MKFCAKCSADIDGTRDGENLCRECEESQIKKAEAQKRRRERESILRDLGLTKVRGALGGVYWE